MIHAEILTPLKKLFEGEVTGILVPGSAGSFEILKDHAPIVSSLDKGVLRLKSATGDKSYQVSGGFVEAQRNRVTVLVESAEEVA